MATGSKSSDPQNSRRAARARLLFRRSPFLVAYWQDGACVATNFRQGKVVPLSARMLDVLNFLGSVRSGSEIAKRFNVKHRDVSDLLSALLGCGLVESTAADHSTDAWAAWDPAAGYFHFSTRDTVFNKHLVDGERALLEKARRAPPPPPTKRVLQAPTTALGDVVTSPLTDVLRNRRTWRAFRRAPVPRKSASTLLKYTFGAQLWAGNPVHGRLALKTSPSGGACHPIEAYVAAVRIQGIEPGLYHYDFERHRLARVKQGVSRRDLQNWIQAQPWFWSAPMVVFLTAVFDRTAWRYPAARAYRNILLEAGHLCQTFCLLATDLGLAPFCTHALHDSRVDTALGLDGVSEGVVYAAGCGVQPKEGWSAEVPGVTIELR
jgi:SagB-type dehydrogenase family enzyme